MASDNPHKPLQIALRCLTCGFDEAVPYALLREFKRARFMCDCGERVIVLDQERANDVLVSVTDSQRCDACAGVHPVVALTTDDGWCGACSACGHVLGMMGGAGSLGSDEHATTTTPQVALVCEQCDFRDAVALASLRSHRLARWHCDCSHHYILVDASYDDEIELCRVEYADFTCETCETQGLLLRVESDESDSLHCRMCGDPWVAPTGERRVEIITTPYVPPKPLERRTAHRVFLCYRRADSAGITGRIGDHLTLAFGADAVFEDIHTLRPGVDYRTAIGEALRSVVVILVIIGKHWLEADEEGRRIDAPGDILRFEILTGLGLGIHTIPVLVDDATMPNRDLLPEAIRELAYRGAARIRHNPDFRSDMASLIAEIRPLLSK